jgi:ATP-binding cassette subfamily F protein 3
MFSGDSADKKVEVLSGGEKSRVMLGKIIASSSNLLLLDEPTNHLDMQSIDALCDAIKEFKGSTIMVTHSEMLLRELADCLIIFHKGGAEYFDGNYDDFLEKIGWEEEGLKKVAKKPKSTLSYKEQKKRKSELTRQKSKESSPHKKELIFCEEEIVKLEQKVEDKNEKLSTATDQNDNQSIIDLSKNIADLNSEIEALFERLEIASEALEEIEKKYEVKFHEIG